METFRCLALAYEAVGRGGNMPCVMNAANEVAVDRFIQGKLPFLGMADFVDNAMKKSSFIPNPSLAELMECDRETREMCNNF